MPLIRVLKTSKVVKLPLAIRNQGIKTTEAISHLYIFTELEAPSLIPSGGIIATKVASAKTLPIEVLRRLVAFDASEIDRSKLGLPEQYRIPESLPPIPPGGVEILSLKFKRNRHGGSETAKFSLRLQTVVGPFDFPFHLQLVNA